MWRRIAVGCGVAVALAAGAATAGAQDLVLPQRPGDLLALGLGAGQTPAMLPAYRRAEPPVTATPRATCLSGAHREPGIQGRVPAGSAVEGLQCNTSEVSHQGSSGGFRTYRYVDRAGHTCAFYDTALLFPANAIRLSGPSLGVAVLDMSDPAHPVQTDTLSTPPMLSPHESLNLNPARGLLAAVNGNPATEPGLVSIYDVSADCRHPVLDATQLVARFGHESGFSPDGRTFYATGTAVQSITAIDVTDPKAPHPIWQGNVLAHGMSLSADGNRAYVADPIPGELAILDTSQIQARRPNPQVREVSRLAWSPRSIPQNAIPFTRAGKPYLLEFDEYADYVEGKSDDVGAARIIDISDDTQPRVVANLRLQVNQAADHKATRSDPGAASPVQGYGAHYCNVPTPTDPTLVACSFIASGLRLFDIRDLTQPKEIGYFVAPTKVRAENFGQASDFAMSEPAFDVARHDVWYTDGTTGFYDVHVDDRVWPGAATATATAAAAPKACASRRAFTASVRVPKGKRVARATATLAGKRVRVTRRGRVVRVHVRLTGSARSTVRLVVRVRLRGGRTVTSRRTYHPCRHAVRG